MAAGKPNPMVPSPPELITGAAPGSCRTAPPTSDCWPTPVTTTLVLLVSRDSSSINCCGLMKIPAGSVARARVPPSRRAACQPVGPIRPAGSRWLAWNRKSRALAPAGRIPPGRLVDFGGVVSRGRGDAVTEFPDRDPVVEAGADVEDEISVPHAPVGCHPCRACPACRGTAVIVRGPRPAP